MSDVSWLNPTPHAIAVYASQPLSPVATQHSLPSGRYPLLGPDLHRLDRTSFAWRTCSITSSVRPINGLGTVRMDENFERRTHQFVGTSESGMLMPISRHPPGCSVRPGAQAIRAANPWAARTAGGVWSRSAAESRGTAVASEEEVPLSRHSAAASEEEVPLSRHSNGDEGPWVIPPISTVQRDNDIRARSFLELANRMRAAHFPFATCSVLHSGITL